MVKQSRVISNCHVYIPGQECSSFHRQPICPYALPCWSQDWLGRWKKCPTSSRQRTQQPHYHPSPCTCSFQTVWARGFSAFDPVRRRWQQPAGIEVTWCRRGIAVTPTRPPSWRSLGPESDISLLSTWRNVRGYFQISSLDCTTHHQARRHSAIFDNSDYSGEGKLQYFEFDTIEWVSERCPGLLNMMVYIHFGPHGTHNSMLTTTDYFGIRLLLLPLH